MNHATQGSGLSLQRFEPDPSMLYPIEAVERLTQIPRRTILVYCRHGLVSPVADSAFRGYFFNHEAIRVLRQIGYLQIAHGINLAGIRFILSLTDGLPRL